jgi:hypothetical protein
MSTANENMIEIKGEHWSGTVSLADPSIRKTWMDALRDPAGEVDLTDLILQAIDVGQATPGLLGGHNLFTRVQFSQDASTIAIQAWPLSTADYLVTLLKVGHFQSRQEMEEQVKKRHDTQDHFCFVLLEANGCEEMWEERFQETEATSITTD